MSLLYSKLIVTSEVGAMLNSMYTGIEHPPFGIVRLLGMITEIGLFTTLTEYVDKAM